MKAIHGSTLVLGLLVMGAAGCAHKDDQSARAKEPRVVHDSRLWPSKGASTTAKPKNAAQLSKNASTTAKPKNALQPSKNVLTNAKSKNANGTSVAAPPSPILGWQDRVGTVRA